MDICRSKACSRAVSIKTQQLCAAHYQRFLRGKELDTPVFDRRLPDWPECSWVGCDRTAESKMGKPPLCPSHANQKRRGEPVRDLRPLGVYKVCRVEGCEKKHHSRGLCANHHQRRRTYNLDPEVFIRLMADPCAICGDTGNIHVDHDHSCCAGAESCGNCVRGALCNKCNVGLGSFRDDISRLERAKSYLQAWDESKG